MEKTLYFTDLDGTFLYNDASIGKLSKSIVNRLLLQGVLFSVSTARTFATVIPMFHGVDLRYPLVLMNGVCIYDPLKKQTIQRHVLPAGDAKEVERIFWKHGKTPMLYFERNGTLRVEYRRLENEHQRAYVSSRDGFYNKGFVQVDAYSFHDADNLVYCVTLDRKEALDPIFHEVSQISGIHWNYYPDNYTGCYFLEGMRAGISKASGALEVKELLGAKRIVAFGDNQNDIALFEAADEAYAVGNANEDLKRVCTAVIGTNEEDAVARFLLERFENGTIDR